MVAENPQYLTKRQAAERLQVSEDTLERQIKAGRIVALKIGRQVRIPAAALLPESLALPKPAPKRTRPAIAAPWKGAAARLTGRVS